MVYMADRISSSIKFVNLHAHTCVGSPFDAISYPPEHLEFAYENGLEAFAITEHGNCNSIPYQVLHAQKMAKEGKKIKPIYGVEAYFHPSIAEWRQLKFEREQEKKFAKEETSGAVMENEEETKSGNKKKDPLKKRGHLVLLAKNQTGLNNIFSLISKSFQDDHFYMFPRIDFDDLREHSEGVIALSACLGGVLAQDFWEHRDSGSEAVVQAICETTEKFQDVLGKENFYHELQWIAAPEQHEYNLCLIEAARRTGAKLVSTCDSHYPRPELWKDRTLYKKLNPRFIHKEAEKPFPQTVEEVGYELYPKNGDQMWESYKKYSELNGVMYDDDLVLQSFERAYNIAHNKIEEFYPDNIVRLPEFVVPEGMTDDEALREASIRGLAAMGLSDDDEGSQVYIQQLEHELKVIADRGFSKYFLTMKAASDEAKERMLVGPGRGSGAGALVSYVLGITQIDPIKWDLSFARFLRSDATDYPDIDYDVSKPMVLKDHLIEKWGSTRVVPISNWNTLQPRSLIKDIARFYGIPHAEANSVTSVMEKEATPAKKQELGITAGVVTLDFNDLKKHSPSLIDFLEKYPDVAEHLDTLYGQVKSASRHAGGVVIGEDLDRHMPLIRSGDVTQTPWSEGQNVRHLEPLGFIKFDFLGLGTLQMMEDAISLILRRHHGVENPTFEDVKKYYDENLHPDVINFNDQKVYENVFHKGKFAGIFQFAQDGMQGFAKRAKPTSLIDITALTSIWRPGPMEANVHNDYVKTKLSGQVSYKDDYIKQVTEETYGFLIFQEQIAKLAVLVGKDITEDEGNLLRKVLTKKGTGKAAEVSKRIHDKFIAGAIEKGLGEARGEELWALMKNFAGYGFNKSHALSYSAITFQTAWLLTYYPAEWLCGFMNEQGEDKKEKGISIVRSLGYDIEPIDLERSGITWEPNTNSTALIQPLYTLKGMGQKAMEKIVANRPYSSIEEMLFGDKKIGKKELDVLIRIGALEYLRDEEVFPTRKSMWKVCVENKPTSKKKYDEAVSLLGNEDEFAQEEDIESQVAVTGVFPFDRIVTPKILQILEDKNIVPISQLNYNGLCWFVPRDKKVKRTKNGKEYWILEVVDVNNQTKSIKCWSITDAANVIEFNKAYIASLDYDPKWGYSTRSLRRTFRKI
jgi:DNA polymerase-3 subunit alpha